MHVHLMTRDGEDACEQARNGAQWAGASCVGGAILINVDSTQKWTCSKHRNSQLRFTLSGRNARVLLETLPARLSDSGQVQQLKLREKRVKTLAARKNH